MNLSQLVGLTISSVSNDVRGPTLVLSNGARIGAPELFDNAQGQLIQNDLKDTADAGGNPADSFYSATVELP